MVVMMALMGRPQDCGRSHSRRGQCGGSESSSGFPDQDGSPVVGRGWVADGDNRVGDERNEVVWDNGQNDVLPFLLGMEKVDINLAAAGKGLQDWHFQEEGVRMWVEHVRGSPAQQLVDVQDEEEVFEVVFQLCEVAIDRVRSCSRCCSGQTADRNHGPLSDPLHYRILDQVLDRVIRKAYHCL